MASLCPRIGGYVRRREKKQNPFKINRYWPCCPVLQITWKLLTTLPIKLIDVWTIQRQYRLTRSFFSFFRELQLEPKWPPLGMVATPNIPHHPNGSLVRPARKRCHDPVLSASRRCMNKLWGTSPHGTHLGGDEPISIFRIKGLQDHYQRMPSIKMKIKAWTRKPCVSMLHDRNKHFFLK